MRTWKTSPASSRRPVQRGAANPPQVVQPPGRPPQVEQHGQLVPVAIPALPVLQSDDTARIARDLVGANEQALRTLKEEGACDISYILPDRARFRVNVFRQRGTFAVVMRV